MNQTVLNLQQENSTFVNNISNENYGVGNEIIYNVEVLKPNFCD